MKTGVVIGASKDSIHTIQKAKEQGIFVIALDGNPNAEGFKYADKSIIVDISNKQAVDDVIAKIDIDFTIPIPIGRYLSTTGWVNDKYNLKGVDYLSTEYSTDKYKFHERLNEFGLRNIAAYLINKNTNKIPDIKYPVIIKPRFGSGSRDVFLADTNKELESIIEQVKALNEDFVLEQLVEGIEYSVDGSVINGELQITLLRKKIITPKPIRQPISSFAVIKDENGKKIYKRVYEKLKEVVKALGYNNCLLNMDLIINENDVFVIEAAPRPSGHNLHDVFEPLATGIDIAEEYIKYLLGKQYKFTTDKIKRIQISFFDFNDVKVKYIPAEEHIRQELQEDLVMWKCNIKLDEYLTKVVNGHSIMGRGFFIIKGTNEQELINRSQWILNQFEFE